MVLLYRIIFDQGSNVINNYKEMQFNKMHIYQET